MASANCRAQRRTSRSRISSASEGPGSGGASRGEVGVGVNELGTLMVTPGLTLRLREGSDEPPMPLTFFAANCSTPS